METKHHNHKNKYFFAIIACVGLIFSCISIIKAFNEGKLYDALGGKIQTDDGSVLGQKIRSIQSTLQANEAVKHQEYEKALYLISGTTSEDYYNRGTIQTLLAYQNALQSSISGLQNAQIFVAQAQQNFDIAKKLATSKTITDTIIDNERTIDSLSSVIDIKTCYGIGQTIVSHINNISTTINAVKATLDQEELYINKRANTLDTTCHKKLRYILDSSKEQIGLLGLQIDKDKMEYLSDFSNKIEDPMICIQMPYENIIPSMTKGQQGLEQYHQLHKDTVEALKTNDSQLIQKICNQTKNDAQINQQIESSVQELLQKLEDNKTENKAQQKSSNEAQYKDFFNEDENKALQEIQTINEGWIDNVLNVRGKGDYNPEQYINDMFNQFYGNSGDFINLHK